MAHKKLPTEFPTDITEIERDLLWHMQNGHQLQTDSLGTQPMLRRIKDNELIRPASASANTVKALERRGLITAAPKSDDLLMLVWRAVNTSKRTKK
jgi:hypothetical protein